MTKRVEAHNNDELFARYGIANKRRAGTLRHRNPPPIALRAKYDRANTIVRFKILKNHDCSDG